MSDLPGEVHLLWCRAAVTGQLVEMSRVGGKGTADLNRSIVRWLEACQHFGVAPPPELIAAIARQLKVVQPLQDHRQITEIAFALALYPKLSNIQLSRACGKSMPTIARWKKHAYLEKTRAAFEAIFIIMTPAEKRLAIRKTTTKFPWLRELFREAKRRNT